MPSIGIGGVDERVSVPRAPLERVSRVWYPAHQSFLADRRAARQSFLAPSEIHDSID
jgi:hypothetical protein